MDNLQIEEKISTAIDNLLAQAQYYKTSEQSVAQMEKGLLSSLLQLGLVLLHSIISYKSETLLNYRPAVLSGEVLKSKGVLRRKYLSLFGYLEISRLVHWSRERGQYIELDERLQLPSKLWSYNLCELVGESSTEVDYKTSVGLLNKLLGLGLSGKSAQRNGDDLGEQVTAYYQAKPVVEVLEPLFFSASFDGKGVPKIVTPSSVDGHPKKRLNKGEKRGKKQMATVSVNSTFIPKIRDKDSVIRSLMGSGLSQLSARLPLQAQSPVDTNNWHQDIHRRAFLADQAGAIEYGLDYIRLRMLHPQSRFVVPIDAGIGLEEKVIAYVEKYQMQDQFAGIILDIIHVSEYVWDAANALFGQDTGTRHDWVKQKLENILDSKTDPVIEDLKAILEKGDLSPAKQKQIQKTITYFDNHKSKMDYRTYLSKGYPVSSALVESTCGHLVKERMEQSGMRWSSQGAQNMLDLRALNINGDLEDFMTFVTNQKQHPFFKIKMAA